MDPSTASLADEPCAPLRAGAERATPRQLAEWSRQVPEWSLIERDEALRLERTFPVPDFAAALAFARVVGEMAEREGHHPSLLVEWGRLTVAWRTLRTRGLHRNDFVMAAKTDRLWEGWTGDGAEG